jgi:hypothetical protein
MKIMWYKRREEGDDSGLVVTLKNAMISPEHVIDRVTLATSHRTGNLARAIARATEILLVNRCHKKNNGTDHPILLGSLPLATPL